MNIAMTGDPDALDPKLQADLDEDFLVALRGWQQEHRAQIFLDSWLDGGYTAAKVGAVVVDFVEDAARKYVLKVCPAGNAGTREGDTHALALASGPKEFVARHLVDQPYPPTVTAAGGLIMFQRVAGGDLGSFRPLSVLYDNAALPGVAAGIAASLLNEWAPDAGIQRMSARECVRAQLGARFATGAPLDQWALAMGDASRAAWLRFERQGLVMPNPLVWLRDGDVDDDQRFLVLHGRAHGDLHLDNIFIRLAPEPEVGTFKLIDLSAWDDQAPLCRDIPHLLLATIGKHLAGVPAGQRRSLLHRILAGVDRKPIGPGSLHNQGLELLSDALLASGDAWAEARDMPEDWRTQLLLGVIASALIQTSVKVHSLDSRWWFFELAATGLARLLDPSPKSPVDDDVALVGPSSSIDADVAAIGERLDEALAGFSGRKTTILVVGEDGLTPPELIARQPWDLVVEFDPATDATGAYAQRSTERRDHRLFTFAQEPSFGRQSTVWLAADGLEGSERGPVELRAWRRRCLPGVQAASVQLARSASRPACICAVGELGGKARAVIEALLDGFTSRVDLLTLAAESAEGLADYQPDILRADPAAVLATLPDRTAAEEGERDATLPGHEGPVVVPEDALAWFVQVGEVVHSEAGRAVDREAPVAEGFYRGGTISWFELDIGADVPRSETPDIIQRVRSDLKDRAPRRISLHHYPGAGGTTVARRVAWELHGEHPVLVVDRVTDYGSLVERVRELHRLTDLAVLVVIESTLETVIDRAYRALRADSVPTVLVIVERRAEEGSGGAGDRSFYVSGLDAAKERQEFVRIFSSKVPEKHPALTRLAGSSNRSIPPFLFGLTTYEHEYVGLTGYVKRGLERATAAEREALKFVALVHHYAGLAIPAVLLAGALDVLANEYVDLRERMSAETLTLLVEEYSDDWRTSHDLVAAEILAQLLTPSGTGAPGATDAWKVSLSTLAIRLITQSADEFGSVLPDDVATIIDQLFIVRHNKSVFTGERDTFSQLMSEIPAMEGRIEVMRTLAERFPDEPHYSAHLGRMYSYEARDHPRALEAIERAIALAPEDDTLYHMKGMVLRNRMRTIIENREALAPADVREQVLTVVHDARREFERSIELNDISEYGHVALAQLCIAAIEFGRGQADSDTYGAFLSTPEAGYYRELLAVAEDSLERAREIRGGDRPSRYSAGAEADLQAFYDDYAALLQGWRNLLDRADIPKPQVRRQLVRAYLKRAGTWRGAHAEDRARAMVLLEENLQDNPADTRSLLEWLRVGRFRGVSLDRASELVNYSIGDPSTAPREVLFYDYVISSLLALGGRDTAAMDYRRKVERSRDRAVAFGNRRFVYEWYTKGTELGQLVHHFDLRDWERSAGGPDPALLSRLEGRVSRIRRPQSGEIEFGPGLRAFFTPAVANLLADRHTNSRVSFLLGFAYEGPQAWSVRLLSGA